MIYARSDMGVIKLSFCPVRSFQLFIGFLINKQLIMHAAPVSAAIVTLNIKLMLNRISRYIIMRPFSFLSIY